MPQIHVPVPRRSYGRQGFTLVELLVVIGIIALLMSILMPSLSRARENAKQVQCLSNMRQLGNAFVMYVNENRGFFPRGASGTQPEDWIYWESSRDISESAIATYIASKPVNKEHFRCPSDDWTVRQGAYPYSYSVNFLMCRLPKTSVDYSTYYRPGETNATMRVTEVVDPSSKILMIDESADTVDDGCWAWQKDYGKDKNVISNRHDKSKEAIKDPSAGRGNAMFVDGHAEYVHRKSAYVAYYYDPKLKP